MAENGFKVGWEGFTYSNPDSWIPTGGNWGGPGWSGGERKSMTFLLPPEPQPLPCTETL